MHVASLELCKELYELSEEWKAIEGLPSYEVSNLGQIRHSKTKRVRKLWHNKDGYASWSINIGGKIKSIDVHRVVAKHFVLDYDATRPQVNHIDSNPAHNCAHNLEWVTPKENVAHAIKSGNMDLTQNRGEKHGMAKLTIEDVREIRNQQKWDDAYGLAIKYGVSIQAIRDIWDGRRWGNVL